MYKTFPIELSEDLHKRLKHAAVDEGMTLHEWILRTLTEKVGSNRVPAEAPPKLRSDYARPSRDH